VKGNLQQLISLQQADLRLEEITLQKQRVPAMIEGARQPLLAAQSRRDTLKKDFDLAVKERKAREQELAEHEQAIGKLEDRAIKGEIKTNKEYQAHKFEIELAKKKKGEVEEQLLMLMDQVDSMKKELGRAEEAVKAAEQRFTAEKTSLETSIGSLDEQLKELSLNRKDIAAGVESSLLRSYEKLRSTRKGQALAGVSKDGTCMACRLQIQPQVVSDVKRATNILSCSYCHRILYWVGEPLPPAQPIEQERPSEEASLQQTAKTAE
jgi:predicted  nucleic acid-binding Zn-ribbon protein